MLVYKITNNTSGKVYIGKTERSFSKRIAYHIQDLKAARHCNRHLQAAFNKYGIGCFKFEVIDKARNKDSLNQLEKNYIALYLATNDRFGYNLTIGGDGSSGWKATDEIRKRMSKSKIGLLSGSKHPNYGKKMSDEHKLVLKAANEMRVRTTGKDNPLFGRKNPEHSARMTGRKQTKEHREKISTSHKIRCVGQVPSSVCIEKSAEVRRISIIGINLSTQERIVFRSIRDASKHIGDAGNNVAQVCYKNRKTCKGWTFSYHESVGG